MNGAQAMIRTLVGAGVTTCFTNPGTSEMHFVAALDTVPEVRAVLGLFEGVVTGAADGYATRWLVGRAVTRSLAGRRLVMVASDYVLLTEAGRRALAGDDQRRGWTAAPVASPGGRGSPALPRGLAWGEAT